jgi:hypothetical protein
MEKGIENGNITVAGKQEIKDLIIEFENYRADAPRKCEFWPESKKYWSQLPLESIFEQLVYSESELDWTDLENDDSLLKPVIESLGYTVKTVPEVFINGRIRGYVEVECIIF